MQESKEQIDNDRSTGWPVLTVEIHKEQVKNYIISFLDRCHATSTSTLSCLSSSPPPLPSPQTSQTGVQPAKQVRRLDNVIQWMNLYPVDGVERFSITYPLDSNLFVG